MNLVSADLPDGAVRTRYAGLAAIELPVPHARTTALLVPGLTGSKEDFSPILPALAAEGVRVVAIDQRGQYESPDDTDPGTFEIPALAQDVLAVAAELGGPVHLVGHSFGGLVAREAVLADRSPWLSLVLMGSGPGAIGGGRADILHTIRPILERGGLTAVVAAQDALTAADPGRVSPPPEVEAFLRHRMLTGSPLALQVMGEALLTAADRVEELQALSGRSDLPLLVVHGEHDDAWSPDVQHAMAARLGASYAVVEGARHSPAAEQPGATAHELLAFWWARAG